MQLIEEVLEVVPMGTWEALDMCPGLFQVDFAPEVPRLRGISEAAHLALPLLLRGAGRQQAPGAAELFFRVVQGAEMVCEPLVGHAFAADGGDVEVSSTVSAGGFKILWEIK